MPKFINFIAFFVFALSYQNLSASQNSKLDSLLHLSDSCAKIDSFTKAVDYLNDVMDLYEYEGDWGNYNKTAEKVYEYALKSGDRLNLSEYHNKMGISCCLNGKNSEALDHFKKALEIHTDLGNEEYSSNSYENMGLVYKDMGDYKLALECQMKSLKIREKYGHPRIAETYSNISQLFEFVGENGKQLAYIRKAQSEAKKYPHKRELQAIICCELGEYYLDYSDQYDSCILYFQEGLKHCEAVNWNRGIAVFLGDLATAYYGKGDIGKSIEYHKKSLELSLKINDCLSICQEYNSLSKLYKEKGNYTKAKSMNRKAIKKSETCEIKYELRYAYMIAAELSELLGNYKQAYSYHKLFHVLSDSLVDAEKHNTILELETRYETEKKEQQIELLSAENELKNQRIKTFVALSAVLLMAAAVAIVLALLRKRKAGQKENELKQKLLRSQMNPHFLFNALGSIQNYMYKNEAMKAAGYLGNFAKLTRGILENSAEEFIPLEKEIGILENYIALERMRQHESFSFGINIDENIDTEFAIVPPMMLQPFVENAIKHGLKDAKENARLTISFSEIDDALKVEIEDNGVGFKALGKDKEKGHRSMSMQIFEERRKIIEKRIKKHISCEIADLNEENADLSGTRITIKFPQTNIE